MSLERSKMDGPAYHQVGESPDKESITSFLVFENEQGDNVYLAYNPRDEDVTVTFFNGTDSETLTVEAHSQAWKADGGNTETQTLSDLSVGAPDPSSTTLYLRSDGQLGITRGSEIHQDEFEFGTDATFTLSNINATYTGTGDTDFSLYVNPYPQWGIQLYEMRNTTMQGLEGDPLFGYGDAQILPIGLEYENVPNPYTVTVAYDFDGDGTDDRTEVYNTVSFSKSPLRNVQLSDANGLSGDPEDLPDFQDMTNGSITVTVSAGDRSPNQKPITPSTTIPEDATLFVDPDQYVIANQPLVGGAIETLTYDGPDGVIQAASVNLGVIAGNAAGDKPLWIIVPDEIGEVEQKITSSTIDGFNPSLHQFITIAKGPGDTVQNGDILGTYAPVYANAPNAGKLDGLSIDAIEAPGNQVWDTAALNAQVSTVMVDSPTAFLSFLSIPFTAEANLLPIAVDDNYLVQEGVELSVDAPGVLENDITAPQTTLTAQLVDDVDNGTLDFNMDGSFTYMPNALFSGLDTFTYQASDGEQLSDLATVTILVSPDLATMPTANDDAFLATAGLTLSVPPTGVLLNDDDPGGGELTALIKDQAMDGMVTLNSDGSFSYTPNPGFADTDTFTYWAIDESDNSDSATVTITVLDSEAPIARDDSYLPEQGQVLSIAAPGVLDNDTSPTGEALTATVVDEPLAGNTLVFNSDGSFVYTPADTFFGTDSFTYSVNDGLKDSDNPATVFLTVQQAPVPIAVPNTFLMNSTSTLQGNVTDNDLVPTERPITATLGSDVTMGTLDFSDTGAFTYTPDPGFTSGNDTFTYSIDDGLNGSSVASVVITVDVFVPTDPPASQSDTYVMDAGGTLAITAPGVLANDTAPNDDSLTATLVDNVNSGMLTFEADGSFTYAPNQGYFGTDSFTYEATDTVTGLSGDETEVLITINAVMPTAADDNYGVAQGLSLVVNAPGLLENDVDPLDEELSAALDTGPMAGNTVTVNSDGSFTYTPDIGFFGTDSFTYTATDESGFTSAPGTVTITVSENIPPIADNNSYSTHENLSLSVSTEDGVLSNDSDPDGHPLTAVLDTGVTDGILNLASDGSFTYAPDQGFSGIDSFTYFANDGIDNSDPATVFIAVIENPKPVAVDDAYSVKVNLSLVVGPETGVLSNDTDPNGEMLTAELVDDVDEGTLQLNADGSFTYTPNQDFDGDDTFTYTANDAAGTSNVATVTISVVENRPPVSFGNSYTTEENISLVVEAPGVLDNDVDFDDDPLTATLVAPPENGMVDFNADGSFTYTPDLNFNGTDTFTYMASDGLDDGNPALVTITVQVINQPPVVDITEAPQDVFDGLPVDLPDVIVTDPDLNDTPDAEIEVTVSVEHGTLDFEEVLESTTLLIQDAGKSGVLTGPLDAVNLSLAAVTYTADFQYFGPDALVVTANDQGFTGAGGPMTDTAFADFEVDNYIPLPPAYSTEIDHYEATIEHLEDAEFEATGQDILHFHRPEARFGSGILEMLDGVRDIEGFEALKKVLARDAFGGIEGGFDVFDPIDFENYIDYLEEFLSNPNSRVSTDIQTPFDLTP